MSEVSCLPLPSLRISGFRGIDELAISRLGRVTLLAGKNGAGKTTVLEAVQAFAARGRRSVLRTILEAHGETISARSDEGEVSWSTDWTALFHGRSASQRAKIEIGPTAGADRLHVEVTSLDGDQNDSLLETLPEHLAGDLQFEDLYAVRVRFRERSRVVGVWSRYADRITALDLSWGLETRRYRGRFLRDGNDEAFAVPLPWERVGPGAPRDQELERYWNKVALTDDEAIAIEALNLCFGERITQVAMTGHDGSRHTSPRSPRVRLQGLDRPVPLRSLGDGAVRLFAVVLALTNARGGFLLIDEAENGIHHTLMTHYWRLVLQAAAANDVQVIATTHSRDCWVGFGQALAELEDAEGALVRLSVSNGNLRTVEYSEDELRVAAEQRIEVR